MYREHIINVTAYLKIPGPWDFSGGPVVKNLPSNAVPIGSLSGRGTKIPHAMGQLNPDAATKTCIAQTWLESGHHHLLPM